MYGAKVQFGSLLGRPVLKPTGFMSNAEVLLDHLRRRCNGLHEHAVCSGRIARDAAKYPRGLCRAIIKGMVSQMKHDGIVSPGCVGLQPLFEVNEVHEPRNEALYSKNYRDDITKQPLLDGLVDEARAKELEYFAPKGVWIKRPKADAFQKTGRPPVSVRWVDVNKGDDQCPKYRSRLVARQLKATDQSGEPFFSPTPPLEALRAVLSLATTSTSEYSPNRNPKHPDRTQVSMVDISRGYFNAKKDPDDLTYVALPNEDKNCQNMCALLARHMYGTRGAADGWQEEYSTTLVELGFVQGMSSACVFVQRERGLVCTVHGDDFTTVGGKLSLDWFEEQLKKHYELTVGPRLGPGAQDAKEATILNRVVRWTAEGLEYEADPRQSEKLIHECGMEGSNSVATPGLKETAAQVAEDVLLEPRLNTAYRSSAARANYLAADRVDIQYASKEVCRWMSAPTVNGWQGLKRLTRFLCGLPRLVYLFPWQSVDAIDVYVDTDWAGCARTRKSTSGGCAMLGGHMIKSWSSTQPGVTLSSGEAELCGVIRGSGMGLGFQSLMADLGHSLPLRVWTDSSAAIGICTRQGLGKMRHIDTHMLWIQQAVRSGRVDLRKVLGEENPADLFTKHLSSRERVQKLVALLGCRYTGGRAESAPQRRVLGGEQKVGIAEANVVTEEGVESAPAPYNPVMPHLLYPGRAEMDRWYPRLGAADDIEGGQDALRDLEDDVFVEGQKVIESIRNDLVTNGRRRRPVE